MSVNRKIFGLASSALVFAGMAYGQALNCNPGPTAPTNPIELRAEGATELVSDTTTVCAGTAAAIQGNVTAFISGSGVQGITSKSIGGGVTEATLSIIDNSGGGNATVYYSGIVSGSQVTFGSSGTPVVFPTYNFIIQVSNVRVNVTGTYPGVPQAVTETVFAGTQGVASLFNPVAVTVGYIRDALAVNGVASPVYTGSGSATAGTAGSNTSFPVCKGAAGAQAFTVTVTELFAGAFKTKTPAVAAPYLLAPASANIPGSESGSLIAPAGLPATVGTATSGTRVKFVFGNIPTNATLSVPTSISVGLIAGTNYNLQVNLTSGTETGAFAQAGATAGAGTNAAVGTTVYGANASLTASGGSAVAIYEVSQANLTVIKSFTLPVNVTFGANAVSAPSGPITVTTSFAPSPATPGAALPNPIPTIPYFSNTGTLLNGATFAVCQTTLLFPFITNQANFETGIAIANTGLDNLAAGGKSIATGQSGACTINFYGSTGAEGGTQPAAPAAANFPASSKTPSTIAPGTTHADTLTDVIGGPFQGYAIAVCPFLYARGFAFIEYGLATSNGVVEGYLADVINSDRSANFVPPVTPNPVLSNAPEFSGQ